MVGYSKLFREEVIAQTAYNAGIAADRFREAYGVDCLAKLDSNENPYGPSPAAIKAAESVSSNLASYPDAATSALRLAISEKLGVKAEQVVTGNGSEDLIALIFTAVLSPGEHVVTTCPSFGPHETGAEVCGATAEKILYPADWLFPIDDVEKALSAKPKVLMFASPNNPAGTAITEADFDRIVQALTPETLFVFDEAYVDFIEPSLRFDAIEKLSKTDLPWISLRTFSKAYGLAGSRIGFAVCSHDDISGALMKIRSPFAVNAVAVAAAAAALEDVGHLAMCVENIRLERERLQDELTKRGYTVAPSQTNFVFFDCKENGNELAERLRRRGVLTKGWFEEPYLGWLRVSIGRPEHTDAFLAALDSVA
ncbi:histidinol-phosphate transaminase [Cognatishimia sp. 1_MG-2023]|uniref:histidinol-phosphate transaminase n=1 Tax=Cognatishimia sp. 1_MG-2023 TaxID=3062642 RepID=UPI0026E232A8|nr:histidinol-phosphate transaminase [Cognatishimia sp. 1_MG-2023]MDO6728258.1 histidinol-phosphate transaminase [Cognatishimia sp. 1_MG-2023]